MGSGWAATGLTGLAEPFTGREDGQKLAGSRTLNLARGGGLRSKHTHPPPGGGGGGQGGGFTERIKPASTLESPGEQDIAPGLRG